MGKEENVTTGLVQESIKICTAEGNILAELQNIGSTKSWRKIKKCKWSINNILVGKENIGFVI